MNQTAPAPAPSATIMVLRERQQALQVFMVVRHHQIDFASGALVFPGGKLDRADSDERFIARSEGAASDPVMRAVQVAAIREAFEESGILLARPRGTSALIDGARLGALDADRDRIHGGEISFHDFLVREDLVLACDALVHFAHWVTPVFVPKRFDTHFFLAVAPPDQVAVHDGHESVDSVWIEPARVLEDAREGRRTVIFPTLRNVEKLGRSSTVEAALAAARVAPPVTVLPWTEQRADGTYLCIPPEAGYDVNEERMDRGPRA